MKDNEGMEYVWEGMTLEGEKFAISVEITEEMVERAARFDHAKEGEVWGARETWDDLGENGQRDYLDHARGMLKAALSASSSPDDASS